MICSMDIALVSHKILLWLRPHEQDTSRDYEPPHFLLDTYNKIK